MADGNVHLHPSVERQQLRRRMVAAVDKLLEAVDVLVRELDSDAPDADLEPSLAHPMGMAMPLPENSMPEGRRYLERILCDADPFGATDDREADGGDPLNLATDADFEPSLGAVGGTACSTARSAAGPAA